MDPQPNNEQQIIRYLLAELPEHEQTQLEERYLDDHDFFEQVRAIEQELIEDYLRGKLQAPLRLRFEQRYMKIPALREQVAFSDALLATAVAERQAPARSTTERISWWQSLYAFFRLRPLAVGYALLAILLVTGIWLLVENRRLHRQLVQERAETQLRAQQLEQLLAAQRGRNTQLTEEVARTAQELERERSKLETLKAATAEPTPSILASLVFLPSLRAANQPKKLLTIPPGEGVVQLRLLLDDDEFRSYRAVLRPEAGGDAIWEQARLRARTRPDKNEEVMLNVPANIFAFKGSKDYVIKLSGRAATGEYVEVDEYRFQITR